MKRVTDLSGNPGSRYFTRTLFKPTQTVSRTKWTPPVPTALQGSSCLVCTDVWTDDLCQTVPTWMPGSRLSQQITINSTHRDSKCLWMLWLISVYLQCMLSVVNELNMLACSLSMWKCEWIPSVITVQPGREKLFLLTGHTSVCQNMCHFILPLGWTYCALNFSWLSFLFQAPLEYFRVTTLT